MGKQSGFALKLQMANAAAVKEARLFTLQQSKDLAMIAVAEMFGLGPKRAAVFSEIYDATFTEYATMVCADTKDIEYSKEKIDQRLRHICGDSFVPFDERYKVDSLMNRYDRRKEKRDRTPKNG